MVTKKDVDAPETDTKWEWKSLVPAATAISAFLAAITGIYAAYSTHNAESFERTLSEHEQIVDSYAKQIESATSRRDSQRVDIIRVEYESYLENWRKSRILIDITPAVAANPAYYANKYASIPIVAMVDSIKKSGYFEALPYETQITSLIVSGDVEQALILARAREHERRSSNSGLTGPAGTTGRTGVPLAQDPFRQMEDPFPSERPALTPALEKFLEETSTLFEEK